MKRAFLLLAALVCVSACDRHKFKWGPPAESTVLKTDSAMIHHDSPDDRSSTSVGIGR